MQQLRQKTEQKENLFLELWYFSLVAQTVTGSNLAQNMLTSRFISLFRSWWDGVKYDPEMKEMAPAGHFKILPEVK